MYNGDTVLELYRRFVCSAYFLFFVFVFQFRAVSDNRNKQEQAYTKRNACHTIEPVPPR